MMLFLILLNCQYLNDLCYILSSITLANTNLKIFIAVIAFTAVYLPLALQFFLPSLLKWNKISRILGIIYLV